MYFGIRDSYMKVFWLNCQKINKLHYLQIITTQPLAAQTFVGIHVCPMNMIITEFEELADKDTYMKSDSNRGANTFLIP